MSLDTPLINPKESSKYDTINISKTSESYICQMVYVYKEYADFKSYNTEIIRVFESHNIAVEHLQSRVKSHYSFDQNLIWDEVKEKLQLHDKDIFEEDYVSINESKGTRFWIIEVCELEGPMTRARLNP